MSIFAILFGVYLYYRGREGEVYAQSQAQLTTQAFGVANTLLLLTSSLFVVSAVRTARCGARHLATRLTAAAMVCETLFIVNKDGRVPIKILHVLQPTTNHFFIKFYVLTGLHPLHVLLGLFLLRLHAVSHQTASLVGAPQTLTVGGQLALGDG